MNSLKSFFLCLASALLSHQAFSDDLTFVGTTEQTITPTHLNTPLQNLAQPREQPQVTSITLPEYKLSEATQRLIYQRAQDILQQKKSVNFSPTRNQSKKKQLGMRNVPVLNQGAHGTCATFAVTAAADALINQGDRISQLCLLQLGNYLETQNLGRSGWDGLSMYTALNRLTNNGFITSANQKKYGCGGLKNYPFYSVDRPYSSISRDTYAQRREPASEKRFTRKTVFTTFNRSATDRVHAIKSSIDAGHRVIISALLPGTVLGNVGAMAWYHYLNDTWVLNDSIAQKIKDQIYFSGHAMVITGYDDDAVATDLSGHRHRGLFTLRNSWGSWIGDGGDFYMSYDYASILTNRGEQLFDNAIKSSD